jgi:hypothetical protein
MKDGGSSVVSEEHMKSYLASFIITSLSDRDNGCIITNDGAMLLGRQPLTIP